MKSWILSVRVLRVLVYCSACYKAMPHTSSPGFNGTKTVLVIEQWPKKWGCNASSSWFGFSSLGPRA